MMPAVSRALHDSPCQARKLAKSTGEPGRSSHHQTACHDFLSLSEHACLHYSWEPADLVLIGVPIRKQAFLRKIEALRIAANL